MCRADRHCKDSNGKFCLLELVSGYWGSFLCLVPITKDNNGGLMELDRKAFLDCFYDSVMGEPHLVSGDVLFQPLYNMAFPERYFGHFPKGFFGGCKLWPLIEIK
jgi:hypothetical protein